MDSLRPSAPSLALSTPVVFSTLCGLQHSLWLSALNVVFSTRCGLQQPLWPSALPVVFNTSCGLQHSLWPRSVPVGAEMREWLVRSRLETSRPETSSPSHPRARQRSSVLSLPLGGLLEEALITTIEIAITAKLFSTPCGLQHSLNLDDLCF